MTDRRVLSKEEIESWWNEGLPRLAKEAEPIVGIPLCIHVWRSHEALRERLEKAEATIQRQGEIIVGLERKIAQAMNTLTWEAGRD